MGLPNLDTFGPRGDGLHSPNEWIELDSLVEKAQLTCGSFLHLNTNPGPTTNVP